jgi:hypothetical protein
MTVGNYDFNSYAAGNKVYGNGSSAPTMGMVDPLGYAERDLKAKARKSALLKTLQARQTQNYMSPDWLRGSNAVQS